MPIKTIIPPGSPKIMLVGEAPGEVEEAYGAPFVGSDGTTLKKILTQAGIFYGDCIITNCSNRRMRTFYADKKRLVPSAEFSQEIERLRQEIISTSPNIIVALGALAMYVLTGNEGIDNFRGTIAPCTLVPGKKVLITQHPKAVHFDYQLFYIMTMDFRKVAHEALSPTLPVENRTLCVAPRKQEAVEYLSYLYHNWEKEDLKLAIDLEHVTPGAHISWFGITHSSTYAMSIEFIQKRLPTFPEMDEVELWHWIGLLIGSGVPLIFHNGSYDVINLWDKGLWCKNVHFDTIIAAHAVWPEFPRTLGFLSSILLNVPAWKHTSGSQYEKGEYNAADVANTRAIYEPLYQIVNSDDNYKLIFDQEMSQIELAGFMQLQGINVNLEARDKLLTEYTTKKNEIETGLNTILKKNINFSSPKQLQELLYVDLGLPTQFKRRKSADDPRKITTDADALDKLFAETQHPVLKLLLEHRKYTKLLQFISTSVSPSNTVHTSYNICGTDTGRWSSSASIILDYGPGNLQNIERTIRDMYVPPTIGGRKTCWVQADYIGAEAHLVANVILDNKLMAAFDNGEDIHKATASFMFGIPVEEVTKDQRTVGKTIRHATNYSAGPGVIQRKLKIPIKLAKEYLTRFLNATPQLQLWHEKLRQELQNGRILTTPLGRKRVFMARWGDQLFRSAYAFIPQSTIGDLLNISFVDFYERYKDFPNVGCSIQLHDAIYIWCFEEEKEYWAEKLYESMHRPIHLPHTDLYIGVDFKWGYDWKNMDKLEINKR